MWFVIGRCLPAGLLDISECYYGFPIALSYPHFLDTDQKVVDQIEGLRPNRSDHETYFMIQPVSTHKHVVVVVVAAGNLCHTDSYDITHA